VSLQQSSLLVQSFGPQVLFGKRPPKNLVVGIAPELFASMNMVPGGKRGMYLNCMSIFVALTELMSITLVATEPGYLIQPKFL
jgi:hypothetical protein